MDDATDGALRRALLQGAAGLAVTGLATVRAAAPPAARTPPPGKPGEFHFLHGEWRIQHRRRVQGGEQAWDEFEGEATCWSVLDGIGSIEELRIPARSFSGIGIRLLDVERRVWSDFWVNSRSGVLTTPGLLGGFTDGVGIFEAADKDGDDPILVRGVWEQITPESCRWFQAVSRDAGRSWEENWVMRWRRVR